MTEHAPQYFDHKTQIAYDRLMGVLHGCHAALVGMRSRARTHRSSLRSRTEYRRIAAGLIERAEGEPMQMQALVRGAKSKNTYYKKLAALRYELMVRFETLIDEFSKHPKVMDSEYCDRWSQPFQRQLEMMQALSSLRSEGFTGVRRPRNSKSKALAGLPSDWREQLCQRGQNGKYRHALLAAALTGCRPAELARGICVSIELDALTQTECLTFTVPGVKVKENQGQPERQIKYAVDDRHPLVVSMTQALAIEANLPSTVRIEVPVNFTTEIKRLARLLWPKHRHTVTGYCFRHQWAADSKLHGDGDATSRGLGHLSAKTSRNYGRATQSRTDGALKPAAVSATRPVKQYVSSRPTRRRARKGSKNDPDASS